MRASRSLPVHAGHEDISLAIACICSRSTFSGLHPPTGGDRATDWRRSVTAGQTYGCNGADAKGDSALRAASEGRTHEGGNRQGWAPIWRAIAERGTPNYVHARRRAR